MNLVYKTMKSVCHWQCAQGRKRQIRSYLSGARKPWSKGYSFSKFEFIKDVLEDSAQMSLFKNGAHLGEGFGHGYDERVVEYPWTLTRLPEHAGRFLDAGSVFNFPEIVDRPELANKDVTIFTLAPEKYAFWQKGISYQYGDLRELPFRDDWFDSICTLSTLGHVGMDCRVYTKKESEVSIGLEAETAVRELMRVLKPGGRLLASVVFGKHQLINIDGAPFAEQFDRPLLASLLRAFEPCASLTTSFYRYSEKGWDICGEGDCDGLEYYNIHDRKPFDADNAAAARAVALMDVRK